MAARRQPVARRSSVSPASCSRTNRGNGVSRLKAADDVVAIRPGIRSGHVGLVALALAEPDDVKPVPPPPLAVVGRSEQAGRRAFHRPAGQDHSQRRQPPLAREAVRPDRSVRRGGSSEARSASGAGARFLSLSFARMNASIGVRIQRESWPATAGTGGQADRLKRPPVGPGPRRHYWLNLIGCAGLDPAPDRLDLRRSELGSWRHLTCLDLLDQQAFLGVPHHDHRAGLPPEKRRCPAARGPALLSSDWHCGSGCRTPRGSCGLDR